MNNINHQTAAERFSTQPRRIQAGSSTPYEPFGHSAMAPSAPPRKKFTAKGHDSQLQDAQHNAWYTEIRTQNGGLFCGTILRRDKYTITLSLSNETEDGDVGAELILYKQALESVRIIRNRQADTLGAE